jgi:hypothetical protein
MIACSLSFFLIVGAASWESRQYFRGKRVRSMATQTSPRSNTTTRQSPLLRIDGVVMHGNIAEIRGGTDPEATLMINGERVALVFDRSSFRHFIGPLPKGSAIISVTAQDDAGGVHTQQLLLTIP